MKKITNLTLCALIGAATVVYTYPFFQNAAHQVAYKWDGKAEQFHYNFSKYLRYSS
ncbi:hypothetical protein [Crocosphaera sp. XPORK-15E]|uniref:hypothetical protein n=1 Tax=Crocosphaera sp. XPORK-15E TaxID=3110247 RepID=UPI002B21A9AE|nr:hypothetical protein [Crocosphaera sp. XPORK-15E]MEA5534235.1 hypothetical protein [Crocosphaera sp. XPORK-15E]